MGNRDRALDDRRTPPWPAVVRSVHEQVEEDWGAMTNEERVALVWTLSERMWELTGQPFPTYARSEIPVRIQRRA